MAATCAYNGVSIVSLYKSKITSRPVLDDAGRTTVYVEHRLDVTGYVVAQTTDETLTDLRKRMTITGGFLEYHDKGFGDLDVNGMSEAWDAKWGPHPDVLEWMPLGGDSNACRVHWVCVVRIPECDEARYRGAVLAWNWEVTHQIDQDGYSTESVTGYLEIPVTRRAPDDPNPPDNVDRYRERLASTVPLGFQRTTQSWHESSDKRRLDFSWVDVEIPDPLPENVTRITGRHSMRASMKDGAFRKWLFTLDAQITMARGKQKAEALKVWLRLIESRTEDIRKLKGAMLFPTELYFEEELFGRTSRFSYSAQVMAPGKDSSIGLILGASKLWHPLGTDWGRWRASMEAAGVNEVRGFADLRWYYDVIVDLCLGEGKKELPAPTVDPPPLSRVLPPDKKAGEQMRVKVEGLKPDNSWLNYWLRSQWIDDARQARHKPLPPAAVTGDSEDNLSRVNVDGDSTRVRNATGAPGSKQGANATADMFQRVGGASRTLLLDGFAERLGYRVPVPKVESVGGVTTVELRRQVSEEDAGALAGVPIYRTVWRIWYGLPKAPVGRYPTFANPVMSVDGDTDTEDLDFLTA